MGRLLENGIDMVIEVLPPDDFWEDHWSASQRLGECPKQICALNQNVQFLALVKILVQIYITIS